jgi:secreted trypsin-like serine protease
MQYLSLIVFLIIAQSILANEDACNCGMDSCDCSGESASIMGRSIVKILGSVPARPNTWTWVVSVRQSNLYFCVGSILNEWYIITVAHCFEENIHTLSTITVCAGTNLLSDTCRQLRSVEYVAKHPKYNTRTHEYDIALIRVDTPFDFMDTSIGFIHLPDVSHNNEYSQNGTDVVTVGWGKTAISEMSNVLQEITIQIVDKSTDTCDDVVYNHTLQLCAAAPGKGIIFLMK